MKTVSLPAKIVAVIAAIAIAMIAFVPSVAKAYAAESTVTIDSGHYDGYHFDKVQGGFSLQDATFEPGVTYDVHDLIGTVTAENVTHHYGVNTYDYAFGDSLECCDWGQKHVWLLTGETLGSDAGTYTATMWLYWWEGCCWNFDACVTFQWTINPKPVTSFMVDPIDDVVYNGDPHTPAVVVTDGDYVLIEGFDYTVEYVDNVNAGKATAVVTGIGNYTGVVNVNFNILRAKVTPPTAVEGLVYNGQEQTGVVLPEDALYTLENNKAVLAGKYIAVATLKDKQNYEWITTADPEDLEIAWEIAPKKEDEPVVPVTGDNAMTFVVFAAMAIALAGAAMAISRIKHEE